MLTRLKRLGYSTRGILAVTILAVFSGVLEGVGVSLLLPLFALIQAQGTGGNAAEMDGLTTKIIQILQSININPSLESFMLIVGFLVVLRQVVLYILAVVRGRISMQAELYNRIRIFTCVVEARLTAPLSSENGHLINLLTIECKRAAIYVFTILSGATAGFKLVLYVTLCLAISWQGTAITLVVLGVVSLGFARNIMKRSRQESRRMTESNEALAKYFAERLSLLRLIKLAHTETTELGAFRKQARDVSKVSTRLLELAARMNAVVEPTVVLSVLALIYIWVVVLETPLANIGVLVVVVMRLLPLTQELLTNMQSTRTHSHAAEHLLQMRDNLAFDVEPINDGVPFPADLGVGIRLNGVCYSYPPNKDEVTPPLALIDIDLLIPAGKTTALLGPSGAGKSTLFDLLPRLRDPQSGQIFFGDTDARTISLGSLRRHIALVSQEVLLIDGSVTDNLRYGNEGASDDEIRVATKAAFADGFIQALPQGYDTLLGLRGARLSGGQRQRIALARALLARVPILLLDEPTSALDAESELAVQQALEKQQRDHGTTIVIIAHRLSTVNHADLTVVLDQGKVMAVGTHQELMESVPWYQKIVALQH